VDYLTGGDHIADCRQFDLSPVAAYGWREHAIDADLLDPPATGDVRPERGGSLTQGGPHSPPEVHSLLLAKCPDLRGKGKEQAKTDGEADDRGGRAPVRLLVPVQDGLDPMIAKDGG
jgi:hypothetical protein